MCREREYREMEKVRERETYDVGGGEVIVVAARAVRSTPFLYVAYRCLFCIGSMRPVLLPITQTFQNNAEHVSLSHVVHSRLPVSQAQTQEKAKARESPKQLFFLFLCSFVKHYSIKVPLSVIMSR